jgi:hypothetical protein
VFNLTIEVLLFNDSGMKLHSTLSIETSPDLLPGLLLGFDVYNNVQRKRKGQYEDLFDRFRVTISSEGEMAFQDLTDKQKVYFLKDVPRGVYGFFLADYESSTEEITMIFQKIAPTAKKIYSNYPKHEKNQLLREEINEYLNSKLLKKDRE